MSKISKTMILCVTCAALSFPSVVLAEQPAQEGTTQSAVMDNAAPSAGVQSESKVKHKAKHKAKKAKKHKSKSNTAK